MSSLEAPQPATGAEASAGYPVGDSAPVEISAAGSRLTSASRPRSSHQRASDPESATAPGPEVAARPHRPRPAYRVLGSSPGRRGRPHCSARRTASSGRRNCSSGEVARIHARLVSASSISGLASRACRYSRTAAPTNPFAASAPPRLVCADAFRRLPRQRRGELANRFVEPSLRPQHGAPIDPRRRRDRGRVGACVQTVRGRRRAAGLTRTPARGCSAPPPIAGRIRIASWRWRIARLGTPEGQVERGDRLVQARVVGIALRGSFRSRRHLPTTLWARSHPPAACRSSAVRGSTCSHRSPISSPLFCPHRTRCGG